MLNELQGALRAHISTLQRLLESPELESAIALIRSAASGGLRKTDESVMEVIIAVQQLKESLFGNEITNQYEIPRSFWATEFGDAIATAELWTVGGILDRLITVTQATYILYPEDLASKEITENAAVNRVTSLIEHQLFSVHHDPRDASIWLLDSEVRARRESPQHAKSIADYQRKNRHRQHSENK